MVVRSAGVLPSVPTRLAGTQVIAMLDVLFDAQAKAIAGHGGEILIFIGDGLLAIFPIWQDARAGENRTACASAFQRPERPRAFLCFKDDWRDQ